jgi:hypothetical protein
MPHRPQPDYNLLSPDAINELTDTPLNEALGKRTVERMRKQIANYEYYHGKQYVDERTGQLVRASELPRPPGLDYDPTRFATNYFKSVIKRKARWQMGGKHGISVSPQQIDALADTAAPEYEPSAEQAKENRRADAFESLLYTLWQENNMREKLVPAARDRLLAGRVACKLAFNQRTGKLRWIWRPDTEVVPVYSDDDFEDLLAVHFVSWREDDDGKKLIHKQSFELDANNDCWLEEGLYDESLDLVKTIQKRAPLGLDFIPVVLFPVHDLSGEHHANYETSDIRELNDVLNTMNSDAIDSLKFEMFPLTAFLNMPPGTAEKAELAPGAAIEASGAGDGAGEPNIKKVESGCRWTAACKDQYSRVKGAMHEITSLPQIVPQELNFGGLNGDALQVLFHDIINDTEEHWQSWGPRLAELHEKSVRYLQARLDADNFAYSRDDVRSIGENYENEMKFVLPLPDNRKELVELLAVETGAGFESTLGAIERLGVDNATAKKTQIENERQSQRQQADLYGEGDDGSPQL